MSFQNLTPEAQTWAAEAWDEVQLDACFLLFFNNQAELMSGFIEFCVELKSTSETGAVAEADGGENPSQSKQPGGPEGSGRNGRGGRRAVLQRQPSVVCSRVGALNTISYVADGESVPLSVVCIITSRNQ